MDIALTGIVFKERTHHRQRTDRPCDEIREHHTNCSPQKHDQEGLRQELQPNVALAGAQSAAQADLADTLIDGNQHDVHHTHAADPQRERADEGQ